MKVYAHKKFKSSGRISKKPTHVFTKVASLEEAKEKFSNLYLLNLDDFEFSWEDESIPIRNRSLSSLVKMSPTTPQVVDVWLDTLKKAQEFEKHISSRIEYIMQAIPKAFGNELNYWMVYEYENENGGALNKLFRYNDEYIRGLEVEFSLKEDLTTDLDLGGYCIIDRDGHTIDLFDTGFPKRWLFEDFEEELIQGADLYVAYVQKAKQEEAESRAHRKEAKKLEEERKQELLDGLKSKLTEEERQVLGFT